MRAAVTLHEVRRWALKQRVGRNLLRAFYKQSLRIAVSRLLQAVYREQFGTSSVVLDKPGQLRLVIGRKLKVVAPLDDTTNTYLRLELVDFPSIEVRDRKISLDTANKFFRYFRLCIAADEDELDARQNLAKIKDDFDNSFANLILNRILFHLGGEETRAIEPSFEGHLIYPFPGLRIGVSVDQVVLCSNLSRNPVQIPLVEVAGWEFVSTSYADYETCFHAWNGQATEQPGSWIIPVHPWQMQNSAVIRSLIQIGMVRLTHTFIDAMPLASQRTCRIANTGFDLKLPIDVTLTGEHRLLYQMNALNAPIVSSLVRFIHEMSGHDTIDFQYDLASVTHRDPHISSHLAAIVRTPINERAEERVVTALNLWSGPRLARFLLPCASAEDGYEIFERYCQILLTGPLDFYARWGFAFEPHHQNVLVRLRNGMPTGILLRDVDGTILDAKRIPARLRQFELCLPMANWDAMPPFQIGGGRLIHVLFFDHLPQVMHYLSLHAGCESSTLAGIVESVWQRLLMSSSDWPDDIANELKNRSRTDMRILAMRLSRSTQLMFHSSRPVSGLRLGP